MTDTPFEFRHSRVAEAAIVAVFGEIDMATAPELASAIESVGDGAGRVVVDLSEVTFLDSSGLNALVHCQRALEARQIAFRVVSPANHLIRRVFEIAQLTVPLGLVESLGEALA